MRRRRRNKLLIWIVGLGLFNFVVYTAMYTYIGGDARNGWVKAGRCWVRGHFLHGTQGHASEVSLGVWVYSYLHSVSIWPTIGLVLCSVLVLARPHIIATMQEDNLIRGQSFVTVAMTVIALLTGAATIIFLIDFMRALGAIRTGQDFGA